MLLQACYFKVIWELSRKSPGIISPKQASNEHEVFRIVERELVKGIFV